MQQEISRLHTILNSLSISNRSTTSAAAAALPSVAAPEDTDGRLLRLLMRWREQRVAALRHEIARLQRRLVESSNAAPISLTEWIRQQGGEVSYLFAVVNNMLQLEALSYDDRRFHLCR